MQKEIPSVLSTTEPTPSEPEVVETIEEEEEQVEEVIDKKDPLDVIADPEELRREAKKYRGIASRKGGTELVQKPISDSPYITREEVYENNRKAALDELSNIPDNDPLAEIKREIDDNWSEVISYYSPRNGQKTTEDILEDIYDAHLVWKRRTGGRSSDDSARNLQKTVVTQPTGSSTDNKKEPEKSTFFKKGTPPSEWYKKKD
jgi:hypothetical protein